MEQMSPLAMTGRFTASLTLRINDQSAVPLYIWQRVRPWTVISCAPRSSAIWASSGALRLLWSNPMRILTVTGTFTALTVASIKDAASGRSRIRRSEEHTSELQSLMRISYAVFCLQKYTQLHLVMQYI